MVLLNGSGGAKAEADAYALGLALVLPLCVALQDSMYGEETENYFSFAPG